MNTRIETIYGKNPVLFLAPHGISDINTALLTETVANYIDGFAVINQGFNRGDEVDVTNDIADCNRVDHCKSDVVYEEYLKPILKIRNRITKKDNLLVIHVHGVSDNIHKEANEQVDVVVGYGLGKSKDSLTCKTWKKNLFIDTWRNHSVVGEIYEGAGNGRYAGRSTNNMNQYFRKHDLDNRVDSLQLEFPYSMRKNNAKVTLTAEMLGKVIMEVIMASSYSNTPISKFIH